MKTETILEKLPRRHHIYKSYKSKADARRTYAELFADWMTGIFGSVPFLILNAAWFLVWIIFNTGIIPGITPFDPFPYGLLTMVVSLEAIFLAIIVLISQNRAERIADLREEIDLQINLISEEEVTKVINLLTLLLEKNHIDVSQDQELQQMLRPIQSRDLERSIERQIG